MMFVLALSLLSGLNAGLCIGKYSGLIGNVFFQSYFHNPSIAATQSLMAALFGMLPIGALSTGHFGDALGRRWCLIASATLMAAGCFIESLPLFVNQVSFEVLLVGRGTCGLAVGALLTLTPLYISETVLSEERGVMEVSYQLFIACGVFTDYVLQYFLLTGSNMEVGWKVCLASQLPLALCFCLLALVVPESPRWLAQQSDQDGLRRELSRLRAPVEQQLLDAEVNMMINQNKPAPAVEWSGLLAAVKENNSQMAFGLLLWVQGSGIDTITQYAPEIFANPSDGSKADEKQALLSTVWMGLILVLSTPLPLFVIDTYGRRPLLLVGAIGAPLSMALLALGETLSLSISIRFIWRIAFVILFIVAFNFGIVSVGTVVPPELLASRVRGKIIAVGTAAAMLLNYASVTSYLSLRASIGNAGTFALYSLMNAMFASFAVTYIPETLGCELDADTSGLLEDDMIDKMERPTLANPQD